MTNKNQISKFFDILKIEYCIIQSTCIFQENRLINISTASYSPSKKTRIETKMGVV